MKKKTAWVSPMMLDLKMFKPSDILEARKEGDQEGFKIRYSHRLRKIFRTSYITHASFPALVSHIRAGEDRLIAAIFGGEK